MAQVYYPQVATGYYFIKGQWRFCANASFCNAYAGITYRTTSFNAGLGQLIANRMICPLQWDPSTPFNYSSGFYTYVQVNINDWPNSLNPGITVPKPTTVFPTVTAAWPLPAYTGPNDLNSLYYSDVYWPIHIDYPVVKETTSTGNAKQSMRTKGGKYHSIKNL